MSELSARTAIITGGGTGIGEGVAIALARSGARIIICGRRRQPLQHTLESIQTEGGSCVAVQADVSLAHDAARVVETTIEHYGTVDILINNAGLGGGGHIHEHDIDIWDRVMATNLRGPFLMAREALPVMRRQRRGHIINISSESGLSYYEGDGAYGVSKHALNALSEYIQRENQEYGIHVNTICPGMVVTEMSRGAQGLDHSRCLYATDIADLVMWLLSRRPNVKIGSPVLIQTMENPWR